MTQVNFFGGGRHQRLKIWKGKKRPKFGTIEDNFWL